MCTLEYQSQWKWKLLSCVWLFVTPMDYTWNSPWKSWNSPGQDTGVGSLSLLQGIFPTQGSNPGLLHCGWILYQLSHKGSPRILEWVAYPYFSGSSQPRNQTRVSCIAGKFFTNWAIRVTFTFHFHALENKMATHSRVLAWRIPGTGEPDGLPSMGSHRVGHDWSDLAAAAAVYQIWEW